MKISELKKGDNATMKNVGDVQVIGIAKNYIRVKSDTMTIKIQFASNSAPLDHLGITLNEDIK